MAKKQQTNADLPETELVDKDDLQKLLEESKSNNANLKISIKETRELNRKLDARTRWGLFFGLIGTLATVLAFLLSYQAQIIHFLKLENDKNKAKIEVMEKQNAETVKWKSDVERRLIGRRIGENIGENIKENETEKK